MKIITEGYPKGEEVMLDSISCTYIQEQDCTESSDNEPQEIIISSRDGGGGKFINISTKNWSTTDEKELVTLIKDFKIRAGIE